MGAVELKDSWRGTGDPEIRTSEKWACYRVEGRVIRAGLSDQIEIYRSKRSELM